MRTKKIKTGNFNPSHSTETLHVAEQTAHMEEIKIFLQFFTNVRQNLIAGTCKIVVVDNVIDNIGYLSKVPFNF